MRKKKKRKKKNRFHPQSNSGPSTRRAVSLERLRFTFTAYGKRQLRITQNRKEASKNSPERFFWIKLAKNYLFLCRSNKQ